MANAKITELTELTSVATDDVLPVVDVSESPDVTKKITVANLMVASVPTGSVTAYAGSSAPSGWLLCDGAAVSQSTYAALYAVVGVTYGNPGGGNFNLPNLKGKVPVGYNSGETEFDALGETGGEKTHTLSTAEMPSHTHSYYNPYGSWASGAGGGSFAQQPNSDNTGSAGSGTAHNNLQPYLTLNYIIKT